MKSANRRASTCEQENHSEKYFNQKQDNSDGVNGKIGAVALDRDVLVATWVS